MNHKILIADDEQDILNMLSSFFESQGYLVYKAENGGQVMDLLSHNPDIILLDIGLPDIEGTEIVLRIRDYISRPILFITARDTDSDKIKGFGVGADDYIVKPFSLPELAARVSAHLRRENRTSFKAQIKFSGGLTIDYSARKMYFDGNEIPLAKKEFSIARLLSQNPGQVYDKERIYEKVWSFDDEGDRQVVAEHIRRLRRKIRVFTDRQYIETIWGVGYKWIK